MQIYFNLYKRYQNIDQHFQFLLIIHFFIFQAKVSNNTVVYPRWQMPLPEL